MLFIVFAYLLILNYLIMLIWWAVKPGVKETYQVFLKDLIKMPDSAFLNMCDVLSRMND